MALDPVPWMIGGGAEHSAEVGRLTAYIATSGATGVVDVSDLKVTQTPTASGSVLINPGAAVMPNNYVGGAQQSYEARNASLETFAIPINQTGGTRVLYLILRIIDPQYAGSVEDPVHGPFVKFDLVSSITALPYPNIPLARITSPSGATVVEQAQITDLRKIARPQRSMDLLTAQIGATNVSDSTTYKQWPTQVPFTIDIPVWASKMVFTADAASAWVNTTSAGYGRARGLMRLRLGSLASQESWYDHTSTSNGSRFTQSFSDTLIIPASMRGTTQQIYIEARTSNPGATGIANWVADVYSSVSILTNFIQAAI